VGISSVNDPFREPAAGMLEREDGLVDVTLPIESYGWQEDGSLTVVARGRVHGAMLGFAIDLDPTWSPQLVEGTDTTVYWGGGTLHSLGTDSDAFVALLAREYDLAHDSPMAATVPVTLAGMDCDPARLDSEPGRIKLFFESNADPDAYAEAYLNVDLTQGLATFCEKDPDYRAGLLRSLSADTEI